MTFKTPHVHGQYAHATWHGRPARLCAAGKKYWPSINFFLRVWLVELACLRIL